ncbi:amino acid/polyamine/organocation transporter, APC superfamily [Flavobacterium fluvii]|uniref:Amino acid/polyamine/organocation transporter, APC superfamily n=1 Tax=Flavobacterium fluvii TaxID=468056 RepID=A0A1M5IHJ4_9FLAO|nr:amino acid permease [Flavobacterium fluvii]SHG27737.1 amino acid/polyamine/organocation transporter, APC superfamily [Flavobacterium fluvii]
MSIWKRKPLDLLLAEAADSEKGLKRTLTAWSLVALGIGAIIGAGLFVRTATAAAQSAGPSVTIAFVVAAIGCALAGLCYAELSSSIPISGSAYTYTYATMGEFLAWIIGWDLILEYAVGAATVGIAWSEYLNNLLTNVLHVDPIPYALCHSPFQTSLTGEQGMINLPALFIVTVISLLLIKGIHESAVVNSIIVVVKVLIVILIIVVGWHFINPANHTPYIPPTDVFVDEHGVGHAYGGIMGILGAAGTVFFAFIGFDAVSTAAQETINPKKNMPIGILGSLAVCTVLYILFGHVLTGLEPVEFFRTSGKEASVANAIIHAMGESYNWLAQFITIAILAGFSSVILVMLLGQSRVFYSMGKDGLLPKAFSDLHPKYKTPYKANLAILVIVGAFAAFIPGDIVGDMTSIGTLFAFVLVCISVVILRKKEPNMVREFKTPFVPFVPLLGVFVCCAMMYGLGWTNWLRLFVWMALGVIFYFFYGKKNSRLNNSKE